MGSPSGHGHGAREQWALGLLQYHHTAREQWAVELLHHLATLLGSSGQWTSGSIVPNYLAAVGRETPSIPGSNDPCNSLVGLVHYRGAMGSESLSSLPHYSEQGAVGFLVYSVALLGSSG